MKKRVVVALSGGVDSSVAALILKEKGFEVAGATLILYDECRKQGSKSCCSIEDLLLAKEVSSILQIEHYVFDQRELFLRTVQKNFLSELDRGKTPNPCIFCNKYIKFEFLFNWAIERGFNYIATGHYARVASTNNKTELFRGVDKSKDQSYFLFAVENKYLKRTIFPLGDLKKEEVKKLAKEKGLPTYEKKESQDLCFGKGSTLKKLLKDYGMKEEKGPVLFNGKKIGEHRGLSNYTVGQRRGISIPHSEPLYVVKIDKKNNSLIVGTKEMAKRKQFKVDNWIWRNGEVNGVLDIQVRYRMKPLKAVLKQEKDCYIEWIHESEVAAPGQAAVAYLGEKLVGGGIISYEDF